jgi:hypothetical protein
MSSLSEFMNEGSGPLDKQKLSELGTRPESNDWDPVEWALYSGLLTGALWEALGKIDATLEYIQQCGVLRQEPSKHVIKDLLSGVKE